MGKKTKRSEVSGAYHKNMATGLTAEERQKQNKKANAERAFGGNGSEKGRDVELSENDGKTATYSRCQSWGEGRSKKETPDQQLVLN